MKFFDNFPSCKVCHLKASSVTELVPRLREAPVIIAALAINFVPPFETADLHSIGELRRPLLNQDRTAIDYNGLPRAEPFLHQEQIGLGYVIRLADAAHGQRLPDAFVQVLPFVCTHALPKVGPNDPQEIPR